MVGRGVPPSRMVGRSPRDRRYMESRHLGGATGHPATPREGRAPARPPHPPPVRCVLFSPISSASIPHPPTTSKPTNQLTNQPTNQLPTTIYQLPTFPHWQHGKRSSHRPHSHIFALPPCATAINLVSYQSAMALCQSHRQAGRPPLMARSDPRHYFYSGE